MIIPRGWAFSYERGTHVTRSGSWVGSLGAQYVERPAAKSLFDQLGAGALCKVTPVILHGVVSPDEFLHGVVSPEGRDLLGRAAEQLQQHRAPAPQGEGLPPMMCGGGPVPLYPSIFPTVERGGGVARLEGCCGRDERGEGAHGLRGVQLLLRNAKRFRGGLVFKARRLCVSLNSRLESNKEEEEEEGSLGGVSVVGVGLGRVVHLQSGRLARAQPILSRGGGGRVAVKALLEGLKGVQRA